MPSKNALRSKGVSNTLLFVDLGDRGEGDDLPPFLLENVADQIVLVRPLHDNDDRARTWSLRRE